MAREDTGGISPFRVAARQCAIKRPRFLRTLFWLRFFPVGVGKMFGPNGPSQFFTKA